VSIQDIESFSAMQWASCVPRTLTRLTPASLLAPLRAASAFQKGVIVSRAQR
jgi:hypothetical protein